MYVCLWIIESTTIMNDNLIITIGRQFGSGGREIGKRLADLFGIAYYERTQHRVFRESRRAGSKRFIKFFFNKLAHRSRRNMGRRRPIERIHFQISIRRHSSFSWNSIVCHRRTLRRLYSQTIPTMLQCIYTCSPWRQNRENHQPLTWNDSKRGYRTRRKEK